MPARHSARYCELRIEVHSLTRPVIVARQATLRSRSRIDAQLAGFASEIARHSHRRSKSRMGEHGEAFPCETGPSATMAATMAIEPLRLCNRPGTDASILYGLLAAAHGAVADHEPDREQDYLEHYADG
jgi:hypothetical protein